MNSSVGCLPAAQARALMGVIWLRRRYLAFCCVWACVSGTLETECIQWLLDKPLWWELLGSVLLTPVLRVVQRRQSHRVVPCFPSTHSQRFFCTFWLRFDFFFFCLDSEAFPRSQLKARGIYGSSSSSSLVAPPFPFYNPDSDHWNLCLVILSILFPKFPLPWDTISFPWGNMSDLTLLCSPQ